MLRSRRVRRFIRCTHSARSTRKLRVYLHRYKRGHRWQIRFYRLVPWEQAWAHRTSSCESGHNGATNTGNGYYGGFQFSASTAWAAGFRVLPHLTSWWEQAVRSVRWMHIAGASQWPVCGH